jgi:hypothetical protein
MRTVFLTIFGAAGLAVLIVRLSAQVTDQAALEHIRDTVRSQLHLKPDQFLGVQRDERLEQSLAIAAGRPVGPVYRVSPTGEEIKGNALVHHLSMDVDPTYTVAVDSADGSIYRISGFADSLSEFERLTTATKMRISSLEQAESLTDFYRGVNPENLPLTPILSLIDLKQAAERQCQSGASSFGAGEKAFDAWWKHAKPLYADVEFRQTTTHRDSAYLVEWIVPSSAAPNGNCGGTPLHARLEVRGSGQIGKLTFQPLVKR